MSVELGDGVEYSFAEEYDGPPITLELPRAVPINVDRIPVAAVVSPRPYSDKLLLPIVQPISAADFGKKLSKDLKFSSTELLTVSPTSVIAFEPRNNEVSEGSYSKELGLESDATVSPISVSNVFEDAELVNCRDSGDCALSGEFSDLECRNTDFGVSELNEQGYSSTSRDNSSELMGLVGSSAALGASDRFEKSTELSGSFHNVSVPNGFNEGLDLNEYNRLDWASNDSVLSAEYPSSRVSSHNFGAGNNESCSDLRRGALVTFCDIESDDGNADDFSNSGPEVVRAKKEPAVKVKKGACYRCLKGNRFTEKEVCIVCDAKYCLNCVLRAMGSMPEGRKCVGCIGFPIYEPKRGNLGKCSRMLKRLLNDLEVRQIMTAEKLCDVNQLPPEYVSVNGHPLYHEELIVLRSCSNPPKKLKPGKYWYDKESGLWGKEGKKPSQIISPHLNVGGSIKEDASNGNTQVYINGREITNVELRMLKLAGVQCAGNPHFWVNEDGSYQEEGQKNTKGYIWGKVRFLSNLVLCLLAPSKITEIEGTFIPTAGHALSPLFSVATIQAGTKLLCAVLSLPVPSKASNPSGEHVPTLNSRSFPDHLGHEAVQKLLLIGYSGSGTSTILKQAKILYKDVPFSEDEQDQIKLVIQSNVYSYIGILLDARERFEEESLHELRKNQSCDGSTTSGNVDDKYEKTIYAICPRLKAFSDWLLKTMASGTLEAIFPAACREYAPLVEELWNNAAFQLTYKRKSELETLPSIASYFLERAVEILKPDYKPSDVDILYAERVTSSNGLSCVDFSFPESSNDVAETGDLSDSLLRFQLIRLQAKGFGENCKWLQMFEDVRIVIFCVSLNDYDLFEMDGEGNLANKMVSSKKLFESIVTHPTFDQIDFLLLLNKFDMFEEKIEQVPLSKCDWFDDYQPVTSRNRSNSNNPNHPTMGQLAFHYIAVKFKRLFSSLTSRKLYVSQLKGLEPTSVDFTLKYAKEILNWDEESRNLGLSEYSIYSTETSSSH